jgi:hypothetical protein
VTDFDRGTGGAKRFKPLNYKNGKEGIKKVGFKPHNQPVLFRQKVENREAFGGTCESDKMPP